MTDEKNVPLPDEALDEAAGGRAVSKDAYCAASPYKTHHETKKGSGICRYCKQKFK